MRHQRTSILTLAGVILVGLAGCNRAEEPPAAPPPEPTSAIVEPAPVAAAYVCDSGLGVGVAYPDPQSAQVTYRDRTYVLRTAQAASGARYRDAEVEWRSVTRDGVEQATLSRIVDGDATVVLERCSRPAPAVLTPATPAPATPGDAAPDVVPCRGPDLKLTNDGGDAGMGHRIAIMALQNVGLRACSLTGYPAVTLLDGRGQALTAIRANQRPGSYLRSGQAPAPVTLQPKAKAFFDLAWTVIPHEGEGETTCPTAARIRLTAPGDTSQVSLAQTFTPCGGKIDVSPIRSLAEPPVQPAA
jgi:membrane-bound inhibitor of C-type lysozyme